MVPSSGETPLGPIALHRLPRESVLLLSDTMVEAGPARKPSTSHVLVLTSLDKRELMLLVKKTDSGSQHCQYCEGFNPCVSTLTNALSKPLSIPIHHMCHAHRPTSHTEMILYQIAQRTCIMLFPSFKQKKVINVG